MILAATPVARRVAIRTSLYDHPIGHKERSRVTPYLGWVAVTAGLVFRAVVPDQHPGHQAPLLASALAPLAIGTLDDRRALPVAPRLGVQAGVGALLSGGEPKTVKRLRTRRTNVFAGKVPTGREVELRVALGDETSLTRKLR